MKKIKKIDNMTLFSVILIVVFTSLVLFSHNFILKNNDTIILSKNNLDSYTWEFNINDESIVRIKDVTFKNLEDNYKNDNIEVCYVFEGVSKGETEIEFNYTNFTNNFVEKTKRYKVIVDKKLNLNIEEIN